MLRKEVLVWVLVVGTLQAQQVWDTREMHCRDRCGQFYSLDNSLFTQDNHFGDSCLHGCEVYSRLGQRNGDLPINTLQHCNDSCEEDERYVEENVQACQAGCGFSYDSDTTTPPPVSLSSPRGGGEMVQGSGKPRFITLNLPSLMGQINRMMPSLGRMMQQQQQHAAVSAAFQDPFGEAESSSVEQMEEDERMGEFPMEGMRRMPGFPMMGSIFGRRDHDHLDDPVLDGFFNTVQQQMNSMMQSLPQMEGMNPWSNLPFGQSRSGGQITVIKAGPGYKEEKHYEIGPNGQISELTTSQPQQEFERLRIGDALEHANPMDSQFSQDDVELFDPALLPLENNSLDEVNESSPSPSLSSIDDGLTAAEPRLVVDKEEEEGEGGVVALPQDQEDLRHHFLSVLRDSERFGNQFLNNLKRDYDYMDNNGCNNHNLRWSDWVACVHARLGVPRWLTAATISLGIIFAVWLCLVIPSSAPKQRLRALIVRGRKPSATVRELTAAEAKELEANASKEPVIAIIKVDMPPSYTEVTPGSPAPSYKSDMVAPGSPAPSYKSVDGKPSNDELKTVLEPVHGNKKGDTTIA